ncbi:MAG: T9SS type A sorting domain-containing protein [Bacteroidota bacterium]
MIRISLFLCLILSFPNSYGQKLPQRSLNQFFHQAEEKLQNSEFQPENPGPLDQSSKSNSGIFQLIQKIKQWREHFHIPGSPLGDTLIIGLTPNDSLVISGDYTHTGPILVIGNGVLRFKNCHATIIGDLVVWGDHALVTADSSYLYFPQEYFYQRYLLVAGKGKVVYRNTTLDHSSLSHTVALRDSSTFEEVNVTNIGFTTCGVYQRAEVTIDRINEAGEFVIMDQSRVSFRQATTLLLWHHIPQNAVFHCTFPSGDTVNSYLLNSNTSGISGIQYTVSVDSCYNVMWALMPTSGCDIRINDSKIRSIGLWFEGHDTVNVQGLVNNTSYTDFIAGIPDRTLRLINSKVQTWSLYPMEGSFVNVTGCILGEIGTENHAGVMTSQVFVDGSGGYWWATDTTLMISGFSTAFNAIRSDKNAFFLFAYSTLNIGEAMAMGNSILFIVQSQIPEKPKLRDGSCIWYAKIGKPSSSYVDTVIPVYGSAWIDKTATSSLMDFGHYRLFYQKSGDASWYSASGIISLEKREEILADWDTHGLSPGLYVLKLVLMDNSIDSNKVEALKGVNVMPRLLSVDDKNRTLLHSRVIPNPVTEESAFEFYLPAKGEVELSIVNSLGQIVYQYKGIFEQGGNSVSIYAGGFPAGVYIYFLKTKNQTEMGRIIK